ncbi:MAG: universal stress protein [Myxococcales bacterium]|nr:universal stress protein [Myxococcales bacterium]
MSLERILVATDLSAVSLLSIPWVAGLARGTGARVTVAYVDGVASGLHGAAFDEETEEVKEHLGIFKDALGMMDVACEVRVLSGRAKRVLERTTERGEYDLIVTTRHGERATGLLVGSTTLHLARTSKIPLLVVHGPTPDETPPDAVHIDLETILVSTDFSEVSTEGVYALVPLARALGVRLHIIHVLTVPGAVIDVEAPQFQLPETPAESRNAAHAAQARLDVLAGQLDVETSTEVVCAEVAADGIVATALLRKAQLIAVSSHGKGTITSIILGSTSRRVLTLSPLPVLVLRKDAIGGRAWGGATRSASA